MLQADPNCAKQRKYSKFRITVHRHPSADDARIQGGRHRSCGGLHRPGRADRAAGHQTLRSQTGGLQQGVGRKRGLATRSDRAQRGNRDVLQHFPPARL